MVNKHEVWENIVDYDRQVVSVFKIDSKITELINIIENKEDKIVGDFGCGFGKAFKYLKDYKKVYGIDFSENMLKHALKVKNNNVELIHDKIDSVTLPDKLDLALAVSSITPNNLNQFYIEIQNILLNLKKRGFIYMTLPSFEAKTLSFQYSADLLFKDKNFQKNNIFNKIRKMEIEENYNSLGYFKTKEGDIQKHWLKEEISERLKVINDIKFSIEKLELDWEKQINNSNLKDRTKLWMWFVKIQKN